MRTLLFSLLLPTLAAAQTGTRERGRFSLQGAPATVLAVDPAVKYALIGFDVGTVCVFPADQRVVAVYSHPVHKKSVTGAAFLPDGATFVTVSLDGTLKRWETAAAIKYLREQEEKNGAGKPEPPKPKDTITAHSNFPVLCVAVSPDGKAVATGAADGTVKLWDGHTLKATASLAAAHPGGVRAVAFSPDSKMLASGGTDKTAKLWDVTGEKPVLRHKLDGHDGPVNAVAFSPDGKLLATGTGVPKKSGLVQVWETAAGKPAYKLAGHEDVVTCVVFHPKTEHLASGGADKKIRVWDLKEKATLYTDENSEPLKSLVISPDGARFGTQSSLSVRWWAGFGK
jgi:WD40 repeat protein